MRRVGWFFLAAILLGAGPGAQAACLNLVPQDLSPVSDAADASATSIPQVALPLPPGFFSEIAGDEPVGDPVIQADDIVAEGPPRYSSAAQAPEDEGGNRGGAHFSLDFSYADHYVYRGVDHDAVATHGTSLNLLFDGKLSFDLGHYPHPFVGVFTNIYDADPVSRFQEIRPYIGATWDLRPFELALTQINYIYPEREQLNQPEADFQLGLDDSLLFKTHNPVFSPYVLGAFDYQKNQGWYVETGVHHDIVFEDLGLTLTGEANVAWISGLHQQFVYINTLKSTGWQHWEVGLIAAYSLNALFHVSDRIGEFDLKGYGYYDGKLSNFITANNVLWGGIGLSFRY
jgi:hypothetical protein